jgi:ribose transport system substrate-binding protein
MTMLKWSRPIMATAVAMGVVLAVSACGSGSGSGDKKLTYLPGVAGDNFYISVDCAATAEAKELGYTLDTQAPQKFDATLQRPILDSAIAKKPSALIVTPTDEAALQKSLEQAKRDGIKIVLSDTTTKDPSVAESAVAGDGVEVGKTAFEAIKQAHPEGGKVLVINSAPGISTGDDRGRGFEEAVKADPSFEYLGQQYAQDDNAKAAQLTSAALQKNPDIVGIFGTSGNETQGAATAVRQAGLKGKITVVGVDAYPAQVKALESGDVQALIAQDTKAIGEQSVRQAVNAIEGKKVEKVILTGATIITLESLKTPEGKEAVYKTTC